MFNYSLLETKTFQLSNAGQYEPDSAQDTIHMMFSLLVDVQRMHSIAWNNALAVSSTLANQGTGSSTASYFWTPVKHVKDINGTYAGLSLDIEERGATERIGSSRTYLCNPNSL